MKSLAILVSLALFHTVFAQNSPYIPSGISDSCTTYLTSLSSDTTLQQCISTITQATTAFTPNSKANTTLSSAVNSLCSDSVGCSESTVRSQLASFTVACSGELTGNSTSTTVQEIYDSLYALVPLQAAICTQDSNGTYCVLELPSAATQDSTGTTSVGNLFNAITKRSLGRRETTKYLANLTTFNDDNIPYLLTSSDDPASVLCTPCVQAILANYVAYESKTPHALGIANSFILSGQVALWSGVQQTCGNNFTTNIVNVAGAISNATSAGFTTFASPAGGLTFSALVGMVIASLVAAL